MKKKHPQSRHTIMWAVILCYLFPFIILSSFGAWSVSAPNNWILLSSGLFISSAGSLILFWTIARLEASYQAAAQLSNVPLSHLLNEEAAYSTNEAIIPEPLSSDDSATVFNEAPNEEAEAAREELEKEKLITQKQQEEINALFNALQRVNQEREESNTKLELALRDFDEASRSITQHQQQSKLYILELQDQLTEQKLLTEKKQHQISHLETKVGDLTYEIKTLLQIAERHTDPLLPSSDHESLQNHSDAAPSNAETCDLASKRNVQTGDQASIQLKRCLNIAQKITGSNRFNSQLSSFLDSPADSFTLDLRRLCDTLRIENNCAIVLYSPKESQPLFANNQVKELTGWSPEKFIRNFNLILSESMNDWNQSLSSLSFKPETTAKLSLKSKDGVKMLVNARVGLIPTGIFRHHAIAVLYP